jgi:hypothetical protein
MVSLIDAFRAVAGDFPKDWQDWTKKMLVKVEGSARTHMRSGEIKKPERVWYDMVRLVHVIVAQVASFFFFFLLSDSIKYVVGCVLFAFGGAYINLPHEWCILMNYMGEVPPQTSWRLVKPIVGFVLAGSGAFVMSTDSLKNGEFIVPLILLGLLCLLFLRFMLPAEHDCKKMVDAFCCVVIAFLAMLTQFALWVSVLKNQTFAVGLGMYCFGFLFNTLLGEPKIVGKSVWLSVPRFVFGYGPVVLGLVITTLECFRGAVLR